MNGWISSAVATTLVCRSKQNTCDTHYHLHNMLRNTTPTLLDRDNNYDHQGGDKCGQRQ
jgi:hypothetical protein